MTKPSAKLMTTIKTIESGRGDRGTLLTNERK